MKKLIAAFLCAMLALSLCVSALAYTEGALEYEVNNGSVTIVKYFGKDSEVTVPASIAGNPVNTIATGAFSGTHAAKVNLPDCITTIQEGAMGSNVSVVYSANTNHPTVPEEQPSGGDDKEEEKTPSSDDGEKTKPSSGNKGTAKTTTVTPAAPGANVPITTSPFPQGVTVTGEIPVEEVEVALDDSFLTDNAEDPAVVGGADAEGTHHSSPQVLQLLLPIGIAAAAVAVLAVVLVRRRNDRLEQDDEEE